MLLAHTHRTIISRTHLQVALCLIDESSQADPLARLIFHTWTQQSQVSGQLVGALPRVRCVPRLLICGLGIWQSHAQIPLSRSDRKVRFSKEGIGALPM